MPANKNPTQVTRPDEFPTRDTWPGVWKGFTMNDICHEMDAIKVGGRKEGRASKQQADAGVGWRAQSCSELPPDTQMRAPLAWEPLI